MLHAVSNVFELCGDYRGSLLNLVTQKLLILGPCFINGKTDI